MKKYRIKETGVEVTEVSGFACTIHGERWGLDSLHALGLTLEEIKPKLIERWAVMISNGTWDYSFLTLKDAEDYIKKNFPVTGRIVHLREVEGGE